MEHDVMHNELRPGESAYCATCGKSIFGPGALQINPIALCHCCGHDRKPILGELRGQPQLNSLAQIGRLS